MSKVKHAVLVVSLAISVLVPAGSAFAATAHNSQTGAGTANAYDTAADARDKQIKSGG